jgi:hypothetical protein
MRSRGSVALLLNLRAITGEAPAPWTVVAEGEGWGFAIRPSSGLKPGEFRGRQWTTHREAARMQEVEIAGRAQMANNLLWRWRAHRNDNGASLNTLVAVFGIRSPLGAYVDKWAYTNPPYSSWLEDIVYLGGATSLEMYEDGKCGGNSDQCLRSLAAERMRLHGLRREGTRCVCITGAAHSALLLYYRERLTLLHEIRQIVDDGFYRTQVTRHIRATELALKRIEEAAPREKNGRASDQ